MTDKVITILECALEHLVQSDIWFDVYGRSRLECDWQMSKEQLMYCRGLLEAYEILTDKKIPAIQSAIKVELADNRIA